MKALEVLVVAGWRVERERRRRPLPGAIVERYPWIPAEYRELAESLALAHSPDEKVWLLTSRVFDGSADIAFAWNEWEQQSIAAADGDQRLLAAIKTFWDGHMPFVMSVRDGYEYFALEKRTLGVVTGREPEYEESTQVAASFIEGLIIATRGPAS